MALSFANNSKTYKEPSVYKYNHFLTLENNLLDPPSIIYAKTVQGAPQNPIRLHFPYNANLVKNRAS